MTSVTLLDGKWAFTAHEIYLPQADKWIPQTDFVEGMTWQFCLSCAFCNHEQGVIIESAPDVEAIEMEYIYFAKQRRLTVDVEIQDVYYITFGEFDNSTIQLSSLTNKDSGISVRYTLKRV